MKTSDLFKTAAMAVLCLAAAQPVLAEDTGGAEPKASVYGAAMAIQYGIDHCDITTTLKQRTDVKNKIVELKQQAGISGDLSDADMKDAIGLKTDQDLKNYCTGLSMILPGMIADMLANKPTSQWGKAATASAAPAPAPASGPVTVGDWQIEKFGDAPNDCTATRDYNDPADKNAENTIIIRSGPDQLGLVLQYARWNMTSGDKFSAPLVAPDAVIASDAQWTVDRTGKVIKTSLNPAMLPAIKSATQLIVKFEAGDAAFDVPRIDEAMTALKACTGAK